MRSAGSQQNGKLCGKHREKVQFFPVSVCIYWRIKISLFHRPPIYIPYTLCLHPDVPSLWEIQCCNTPWLLNNKHRTQTQDLTLNLEVQRTLNLWISSQIVWLPGQCNSWFSPLLRPCLFLLVHETFRNQETESLQGRFPAQLLQGWFKGCLGQWPLGRRFVVTPPLLSHLLI